MVDVEFAVQFLVLAHAHEHAALTRNLGNIALLRIAGELALVPPALALGAADAYREFRRLQHQIRLTGAPHARVDPDPQAPRRAAVAALWTHVFGAPWPAGGGADDRVKSRFRERRGDSAMSMADRDGWIWYDGKMVPWRDATTHVLTHTLHYGLGVFEGVRAYKTVDGPAIFRLRDHTDRLFRSAQIFGMKIPFTKEELDAAQLACVRDNKLESCYLRPIVFYGSDAMGVAAKSNPVRVAIAAWPWGAYLGADGARERAFASRRRRSRITTRTSRCATPRPSATTRSRSSPNQEATHDGYDEAMLLDPQGFVCQGSGENVFIVRDGKLHTPDLSGGALNGITRDTIITFAERARHSRSIERRITRDEVYIADEAFFTGTAAEVTPIREYDNRPIGDGIAGRSRRSCRRCSSTRSTAAIRRRRRGSRRSDDGRGARSRRRRRGAARIFRCSARIRGCRCGRAIRASTSTSPRPARRCARIAARATGSSAVRARAGTSGTLPRRRRPGQPESA